MAPVNAVATGAWTINNSNNARQGRALMQSFFANNDPSPMNGTRSGVILTTGLTVMSDLLVQVFSGLQMSVAPGSGMVYRSGQGPYLGWLVGSSVLVTCDTAPVSNPRNDIIVLRVYDAAVGDTVPPSGGPCQVEVITGTPAASPTDPVTPNSVGVITTGLGSGGGVAIPLARAQVSTAGVITLTDIRRSAAIPGTVRVLMPGDSDTAGRVGDMRWNGTGADIKDQTGAWQPIQMGSSPPRGTIGNTSVSGAGTITTTDTVQSEVITATVVSGRRYKITHSRSEAGGNILTNTYRVISGGTLTVAGSTSIRVFNDTTPGSYRTQSRVCYWVATFSGTATFGLSSKVNTGTNTIDSTTPRDMLVEDIGV